MTGVVKGRAGWGRPREEAAPYPGQRAWIFAPAEASE